TVAPEVLDDQSLHQGHAGGREGAVLGQDLGHGAVRCLGPSMEGGDELGLVDQPRLERQQAEEQVARRIDPTWHDRQLPYPVAPAEIVDSPAWCHWRTSPARSPPGFR